MADDRTKAMRFEHPEFIPLSIGFLPATWKRHRGALDELVARHPIVFGEPDPAPRDYDAVGGTYAAGTHVDAWNCVWSNIAEGAEAYVCGHPLPERSMVRTFQPPAPGAGLPHGFMYLRLGYLRGWEEIFMDFAEEPEELRMLVDTVGRYNVGEVRRMLENPPGMAYFGDDLGMQDRLPISPVKWRKYLKPWYAEMYGLCREAGTAVYMHSDGHMVPVIADLIECGVNVINPQIRANGLDRLVEECRGKVCVDLDLDRQLFPFCSPADIDAHIGEAVEELALPEGGLWLHAECGPDVPLENIEAICQAFERYRGWHRA